MLPATLNTGSSALSLPRWAKAFSFPSCPLLPPSLLEGLLLSLDFPFPLAQPLLLSIQCQSAQVCMRSAAGKAMKLGNPGDDSCLGTVEEEGVCFPLAAP